MGDRHVWVTYDTEPGRGNVSLYLAILEDTTTNTSNKSTMSEMSLYTSSSLSINVHTISNPEHSACMMTSTILHDHLVWTRISSVLELYITTAYI